MDLQRSQILGSLEWDLIKMVLTRLIVLLYNSIWFIDKKFLSSTRKPHELTQPMSGLGLSRSKIEVQSNELTGPLQQLDL